MNALLNRMMYTLRSLSVALLLRGMLLLILALSYTVGTARAIIAAKECSTVSKTSLTKKY